MTFRLPDSAREYVLYQRTSLLPDRRRVGWLRRKLVRYGLLSDNYKNFVRSVAHRDSDRIDEQYFAAMKEKSDSLVSYIPRSPSSVLDIGCGMAGLALHLSSHFDFSHIYLLDKTATESSIWYGFESQGAFYSSLDLAKETLVMNGISPSRVNLIEAPTDGVIPLSDGSIDFVVSTASWGFHYPVSTYLESVARLLSDDGVLIIDLRRGTNGIEDLQKHFKTEVLDEHGKYQTVRCVK